MLNRLHIFLFKIFISVENILIQGMFTTIFKVNFLYLLRKMWFFLFRFFEWQTSIILVVVRLSKIYGRFSSWFYEILIIQRICFDNFRGVVKFFGNKFEYIDLLGTSHFNTTLIERQKKRFHKSKPTNHTFFKQKRQFSYQTTHFKTLLNTCSKLNIIQIVFLMRQYTFNKSFYFIFFVKNFAIY